MMVDGGKILQNVSKYGAFCDTIASMANTVLIICLKIKMNIRYVQCITFVCFVFLTAAMVNTVLINCAYYINIHKI